MHEFMNVNIFPHMLSMIFARIKVAIVKSQFWVTLSLVYFSIRC